MLYGTVILGLPLFVVGATFGQEYDRLMKDAKRRLELQNSREGRNAQMHQEKTAQFAKATSNFIEEHAIFCEAIKENADLIWASLTRSAATGRRASRRRSWS
ncbi:unnamed protein product [Effrenium voratum]|uniref:Uncharacterized protein n=1 Tax=Effrenium voratum TaxID=2562239 RepID=A0AA36NIT1_9DINO|nr:unnamed protein product [Effrenium voratum]